MTLLALHALSFVAGSLLLVLIYLATGGDAALLSQAGSAPVAAAQAGLWPMWVVAFWALALAFHAGAALLARRALRRRRRRRQGRAPAASAPPWTAAAFTDVVGSTALAERLGDEAYARRIAGHRETVRGLLADHSGTEVGTQGDGFLLRFDRVDDAVGFAAALQHRLASHRAADPEALRVRVGLHAGPVEHGDGGDVLGRMVNVAARVAHQAGADEVLLTEAVAEHASGALDVDDRGLTELAGVRAPRHLLALRWHDGDPSPPQGAP